MGCIGQLNTTVKHMLHCPKLFVELFFKDSSPSFLFLKTRDSVALVVTSLKKGPQLSFSLHVYEGNIKLLSGRLISVVVNVQLNCDCCSVTKSCLTLFDTMDCSTPGFPVLYQCSNSCPLSRCCHATISSSSPPSSPTLNLSQHQGLFTSGGQNIGASTSASILPVSIRGGFPLALTGLMPSAEGHK